METAVPHRPTASLATDHTQPLDFLVLAQAIAARLNKTEVQASELRAEALFAFAESQAHFDADLGHRALTHAYWRMFGRPRDLLRRERRFANLRKAVQNQRVSTTLRQTSTPLAVRQVLRQVGEQLSAHEALVLREVYYAGRSLNETAAAAGESPDALGRAHKRLLERLRSPMAAGLGWNAGETN